MYIALNPFINYKLRVGPLFNKSLRYSLGSNYFYDKPIQSTKEVIYLCVVRNFPSTGGLLECRRRNISLSAINNFLIIYTSGTRRLKQNSMYRY